VGLGLAALAAVEAGVAAIPMAVPASSEPAIAALTKSLFDLNANCICCLLSGGCGCQLTQVSLEAVDWRSITKS